MLLATAFFVLVTGVGLLTTQLAGARGWRAVGLAPGAGFALLAVLSSLGASLGVLPLVGVPLFGGFVLAGAIVAIRALQHTPLKIWMDPRFPLAAGTLLAAVTVSLVMMGVAFSGTEVPLWSGDGAFHVEIIQMLRDGSKWPGSYPPGHHAIVASFLQLVPDIDSAQGAFEASMGLVPLAVLTAFMFALAIWRDPLLAAGGALLTALSFQYPYHLQFWSIWPLSAAIFLVFALWAAAVEYFRQPTTRMAVLIGVLGAGVVLAHGYEAYTVLVGLSALLISFRHNLEWKRISRDGAIALATAVVLAGPYLTTLAGWFWGRILARGVLENPWAFVYRPYYEAADSSPAPIWFVILFLLAVTAGLGWDLPLRLGLLAAGVGRSFGEKRGRIVVVLLLIFQVLGLASAYVDIPWVKELSRVTRSWVHPDRLAMVIGLLAATLQGFALMLLLRSLAGRMSRWFSKSSSRSPAKTLVRSSSFTLLLLLGVAYSALMSQRLVSQAERHDVYTADDARAMAWFRENARPGETVANDWLGDAGIWIPYKAGLPILLPRTLIAEFPEDRFLIAFSVSALERVPEASAVACRLGLRYIYKGAKASPPVPGKVYYSYGHFPPTDDLRKSEVLEEVFVSGKASIFRINLGCPVS